MRGDGQRTSEADAPDPEPAAAPHEAELERRAADSTRRLRNGLISLAVLVALVVGLLLAIPGLHGVGQTVTHMRAGWLVVAAVLEILSCLGYVLAFLQVFERAPVRFGARVALSELAFGAAVSLGGAGSVALGGWLLVERGGSVQRVAERSTVLFLLTSAINVFTFALAGLLLATDLFAGPGQRAARAATRGRLRSPPLVFFALLPRIIERRATRRLPRKVYVALCTLAAQDPRHRGTAAASRLADHRRDRVSVVRHRRAHGVLCRRRRRRRRCWPSCSPTSSPTCRTSSPSRATSGCWTGAWSGRSSSTASPPPRPPRR